MSDDIGKLADEVISRRKTTEELRHVPFEMYARVLARAECAETNNEMFQRMLWEGSVALDTQQKLLDGANARAERAEAQLAEANARSDAEMERVKET